jgi:hypothetical protein
LTCVITRVEIDEEPLLPKVQVPNDKSTNDSTGVSLVEGSTDADEKDTKSDINTTTPENLAYAVTHANTTNDTMALRMIVMRRME